MAKIFYASPSFVPANLPKTPGEYYQFCTTLAPRLMTPDNLKTAQELEQTYGMNGGFIYRDAPSTLLLFRVPHTTAIENKTRGVMLPDPTIFPELNPGEGIGLGFLLASAGLSLRAKPIDGPFDKVRPQEQNLFDNHPWLDPNYPSIVSVQPAPGLPVLTFKSAQAAYQACKCPTRAETFVELSAKDAWSLGQKTDRKARWTHEEKRIAMRRVQRAKFANNTELYWRLMSLRDPKSGYDGLRILADYASNAGFDMPFGTFWGTKPSTQNAGLNSPKESPENALGEILMMLRDELLHDAPTITLLQAITMTSNTYDEWSGEALPIFVKTLGDNTALEFRPKRDVPDSKNRYPELITHFDPFDTHVVRILPVTDRSRNASRTLTGIEFTVY